MTEGDWRVTTDVPTLLRWAVPRGTRRQLRLYLCGGCRQIADQFYHPACMAAVDAAERWADGRISMWDFRGASAEAECLMYDFMFEASFPYDSAEERDAIIRGFIALGALPAGFRIGDAWDINPSVRQRLQAAAGLASDSTGWYPDWEADRVKMRVEHWSRHLSPAGWPGRWLVDCLYGNPFRLPVVRPEWRTPTVLTIADGVYTDRAYDRLPVLADALEDAGCDDADLFAHCRDGGPHARGCWVVDRVLDKPDESAFQSRGG